MNNENDFQASDILGSSTPLGPGRSPQSSFSWRFLVSLGIGGLIVLYVSRLARVYILRWKERRYRLAMRRRFGIPDSDHRPFNVAYAAVQLAQENSNKRTKPFLGIKPIDVPNGTSDGPLRQRTGAPTTRDLVQFPSQRASSTSREHRPPQKSTQYFETSGEIGDASSSKTALSKLSVPAKHSRQVSQTSRDESSELENLHYEQQDNVDASVSELHTRKQKRMAESSDDDYDEMGIAHTGHNEKRQRRISNRTPNTLPDDDVEMTDVLGLLPSQRGKKRDRTEADSTVGDDDTNGWDTEEHRRRRRRHRKSSTARTRGLKRERGSDLTSEDGDEDTRRFTGKSFRRRQNDDSGIDEDTNDDGISQASHDLTFKGRRVGEEWEAHGFRHKIGPDGQRLTQTLVLIDRPLYSMPRDSTHPDRDASVQAISEQWLTDQELKEAKDRQVLAWQSPGRPSLGVNLSGRSLPSSTKPGKEMLWQPSSGPGSPSPMKRFLGVLPSTPPPMTISSQRSSANIRRVASMVMGDAKLPEFAPSLRPGRSYSKWQRQEIEADAMERLRRKNEEELAKSRPQSMTTANVALSATSPTGSNDAPSSTNPSTVDSAGSTANPTITTSVPQSLQTQPAPPTKPDETAKSLFPFPASTNKDQLALLSEPKQIQPQVANPSSLSVAPEPTSKVPFPALAPAPAPASVSNTHLQSTNPNFFESKATPPVSTTQSSSIPNFFGPKVTPNPTLNVTSTIVPTGSSASKDKPVFSFAKPISPSPLPSLFPSQQAPSDNNTSGPSLFSVPRPVQTREVQNASVTGSETSTSDGSKLKFNFNVPKANNTASTTNTAGISSAPATEGSKPNTLFSFKSSFAQPTSNPTAQLYSAEIIKNEGNNPTSIFSSGNKTSGANPFAVQTSPTSSTAFSPFSVPASKPNQGAPIWGGISGNSAKTETSKSMPVFGSAFTPANMSKSPFEGSNSMPSTLSAPTTAPKSFFSLEKASSQPDMVGAQAEKSSSGSSVTVVPTSGTASSSQDALPKQPTKPTFSFNFSSAANSGANPSSHGGVPSSNPFPFNTTEKGSSAFNFGSKDSKDSK